MKSGIMNTRHSWNYFLKRTFSKKSTWIILILHIFVLSFFFLTFDKKNEWFLGRQWVEVGKRGTLEFYAGYTNPTIKNVNDFFACVFPNLIVLPLVVWTFFISPISWIFWGQFDEVGQKIQTDGTDLFFLSTEIPTSRKQIFWGKVTFLTSLLIGLYLILFALPLSLLLWRTNYFNNFTGLHTFLFLAWNFLVTPLLLFAPLVVLLFSLASLNSVWYTFLKWFGRLSIIFISLLGILVFQALYQGGGAGKKILEWGKEFFKWLSKNHLLTTLTIMGIVIFLTVLTLSLAYKKFQKKDLH